MRFLATVVLASSTAAAAAPIDVHLAPDGSMRARQAVAPTSATATAQSRTLYLNRDAGTLTPGSNNSQTDTSSLITQPTTIGGWEVDDAKWAETLSCVRAMWAPFDVSITDVDPGSTPHFEVHIGGSPAVLGLPSKIGGIAPMAIDCSIVERSIVFVFPENLRNDPQTVCEVVAQEVGHSYGLDHELLPADPMTYLDYAGNRTFQDTSSACGESTARPCGIDGHVCRATQNSFRVLLERIGVPGSDHEPPMLEIVTPRDNEVVERGFEVIASASDNTEIERLTLFVDGGAVVVESDSLAIATDAEMPVGTHELVIEVADRAGNTTTERVSVRLEDGASSSTPSIGCSSSGGAGWLVALALLKYVRSGGRRRRSGRASPTRARARSTLV